MGTWIRFDPVSYICDGHSLDILGELGSSQLDCHEDKEGNEEEGNIAQASARTKEEKAWLE